MSHGTMNLTEATVTTGQEAMAEKITERCVRLFVTLGNVMFKNMKVIIINVMIWFLLILQLVCCVVNREIRRHETAVMTR